MTKTTTDFPLNICGLPTIRNRGAISWGPNGLIGVGTGTDILIIDSENLSPVQVINSEHKSSINRIIFNPYARQLIDSKSSKYHADLLSTDTLNNIFVWDIGDKSQILSSFNNIEGKQLLDVKWAHGPDTWKRTKVYLLYSTNLFVIYDVHNHHSYQNVQIFEPQGIDLTSFDYNPYAANTNNSLAFLGEGYVSLCNFDPLKIGDKMVVTVSISLSKSGQHLPNVSTLGLGLGQSNSSHDLSVSQPLLSSIGKRQSSSSSIRKLVSDIIVGPENPLNQIIVRFGTLEFLHSMKDHLLVWTAREIYLINTHFHVVLNVLSLEKSITSIISIIPCKTRPAIFSLHENGTIFLRKYVINSPHHNVTMSLDIVSANENPRFSSKKSEVLGGSLDSANENQFILYLSDGRFISYSVLSGSKDTWKSHPYSANQSKLLLPTPVTPGTYNESQGFSSNYIAGIPAPRLATESTNNSSSNNQINENSSSSTSKLSSLVSGVLESADSNSTSSPVRLKLKRVSSSVGQVSCLKSLGKGVLVAGTASGHVLVIKCGNSNGVSTGDTPRAPKIYKKFSIHSNTPVNGIEAVNEQEILTWANLSFSANPKCELCLTEVSFGGTKILKQDEPSHIGAVRVSPLKNYFIIVYKNGAAPCELWDLKRCQLIKMLPTKLPPISCVQWREPTEDSKEETFYMTDLGTFLFTFRVDGNRFSNATCVKLDTSGNMGGIPVSLFTRGNLLFRADSSGTLVIYNSEKKTASAGVSLGRGPLFKIIDFGDYFITQFSDQIELWDLNGVQKLRVLHANKLKSTDFSLVNDNVLAVLVKNSGGLKFLPLNTASSSAGDWYPTVKKERSLLTNYPHFLSNRDKCRKILDFLSGEKEKNPKDYLALAYTLNFEPDEIKFWSVVVNSICLKKDEDDRRKSFVDPDVFSDGKTYKEILVKIAQCVWLIDPKKREDVSRTLILSGESEKSAEILLDTEPSDKNYIANGLKAAVSVGCNNMPEATKAVLKIVATNLIASGQNDNGLEILCMLSKHTEACKYIEQSNDWEKALLLCKTTLSEPSSSVQGNETLSHDKEIRVSVLSKYAQYLNTHRFVFKAASIFVYIGKYDRAVEVLFGARRRHLAYALLDICESNQINVPVSNHIKLAIKMDFARFIFDMGLSKEAISIAESLGEEGTDVKAELEILSS